MPEHELKETCKFLLDNGNRKLTAFEKELLKKAIDESCNLNELMLVAMTILAIDSNR